MTYGNKSVYETVREELDTRGVFRDLSYPVEVLNFSAGTQDNRRGRTDRPTLDESRSGITDGQIRRSKLPRTTTTEAGLAVDYDSQIYILDETYPVYSGDDRAADAPTEFRAPDEPSNKRYRTLDYRSQHNGLLEIDVEEIYHEPSDRDEPRMASHPDAGLTITNEEIETSGETESESEGEGESESESDQPVSTEPTSSHERGD